MTHSPDTPTDDPLAAFAPSEEWRQALDAAPRSAFVPDQVWTLEEGLLDRHLTPQAWHAVLQRDDALLTQIDDGATELSSEAPWRARSWSSSCSAPNMVFDFLGLLDPYAGDRVLEIGTGTGWTAGLLCAYLGSEQVTSIEVDEQIAAQAKHSLATAGYSPTLIVGDGAAGHPDGAPYDRVHVTAGVREIPYTWITQTRPGGIIVLPWIYKGVGAGLKTKLTVADGCAIGRFHGATAYMTLRSHRPNPVPLDAEPRYRTARIEPRRIGRAGTGLAVTLAGMLPGVVVDPSEHPDGSYRVVVEHEPTGSHAIAVWPGEDASTEVRQRGPRDLWEELEAAYLTWVSWGEPGVERLGLTVDANGQHIWLDSPNNQIAEVSR